MISLSEDLTTTASKSTNSWCVSSMKGKPKTSESDHCSADIMKLPRKVVQEYSYLRFLTLTSVMKI